MTSHLSPLASHLGSRLFVLMHSRPTHDGRSQSNAWSQQLLFHGKVFVIPSEDINYVLRGVQCVVCGVGKVFFIPTEDINYVLKCKVWCAVCGMWGRESIQHPQPRHQRCM